jgi:transposase
MPQLISQYIDQTGTEILVFEFRPPYMDAIARIEGQWEKIKGGGLRAWYTRREWEDCMLLVEGLMTGDKEYA